MNFQRCSAIDGSTQILCSGILKNKNGSVRLYGNKSSQKTIAILAFSHTRVLSYLHSLIFAFSHTRILSYSHSLILAFSHTRVLSYSHSLILAFSHSAEAARVSPGQGSSSDSTIHQICCLRIPAIQTGIYSVVYIIFQSSLANVCFLSLSLTPPLFLSPFLSPSHLPLPGPPLLPPFPLPPAHSDREPTGGRHL